MHMGLAMRDKPSKPEHFEAFIVDVRPATATQVGGQHYKDMAIQPTEFIMANKIDYLAGNVIKYVCRHDKKNGKEDLEKAKHYIDLMIEHYYLRSD